MFPEIVNTTHATREAAEFFHAFFSAKNRHDCPRTNCGTAWSRKRIARTMQIGSVRSPGCGHAGGLREVL
jgi:hypothetical protein